MQKLDNTSILKILTELQTKIPKSVHWRLDGDVNLYVQGMADEVEYIDLTTNEAGLAELEKEYGPAKNKPLGKFILIPLAGTEIEVAAYDDGLNLLKFAKPHIWNDLELQVLQANWAKVFYEKIGKHEKIKPIHDYKNRQRLALRQLRELAKYGEPERLAADEWDAEWKTLIAIMLSARTRDDVTIGVGEELFTEYPSLESVANASPKDIAKIINSVNYFQNKSEYVQQTAQKLLENYGGRVPHDIKELTTLPGVGRKTANVFLAQYGHPAIGVDTHVQQVANALNWSNKEEPDAIEQDLRNLFPRTKWRDVNTTCVLFGRTNQSKEKKEEYYELLNSYA